MAPYDKGYLDGLITAVAIIVEETANLSLQKMDNRTWQALWKINQRLYAEAVKKA